MPKVPGNKAFRLPAGLLHCLCNPNLVWLFRGSVCRGVAGVGGGGLV